MVPRRVHLNNIKCRKMGGSAGRRREKSIFETKQQKLLFDFLLVPEIVRNDSIWLAVRTCWCGIRYKCNTKSCTTTSQPRKRFRCVMWANKNNSIGGGRYFYSKSKSGWGPCGFVDGSMMVGRPRLWGRCHDSRRFYRIESRNSDWNGKFISHKTLSENEKWAQLPFGYGVVE